MLEPASLRFYTAVMPGCERRAGLDHLYLGGETLASRLHRGMVSKLHPEAHRVTNRYGAD